MNEIVSTSATRDQCNLAMLAHLLGIFTGLFGALVVWLFKRDDSTFVAEHAKEALNFQITMTIAFFVCWMLAFVVIGKLIIPVLMLINLVFCILAAVAASKGNGYRYPFALRLVK